MGAWGILDPNGLVVVVARLPELSPSDLFLEGELEGLEGFGEGFCFWFAEEEMDVFGHEDVAVDVEVCSVSGSVRVSLRTAGRTAARWVRGGSN